MEASCPIILGVVRHRVQREDTGFGRGVRVGIYSQAQLLFKAAISRMTESLPSRTEITEYILKLNYYLKQQFLG
jgi:hypothetical protein